MNIGKNMDIGKYRQVFFTEIVQQSPVKIGIAKYNSLNSGNKAAKGIFRQSYFLNPA